MTPRTVGVLLGREPSHRYSVHRGYVDALWGLGALPVLITPSPDGPEAVLDALDRLDAVLLTGGGDVDPAQYSGAHSGETAPSLMDLDPLRDAMEIGVARWTMTTGRRLLGICRGMQVLAVAAGGRLVPDLPAAGFQGHWQEERQYEPVHAIEAEHGSLAGQSLGGAGFVNSIHHQAVGQAGTLRPSAWSSDGVLEAVEHDEVLGVQWHPERLLADERHLAPFRWLIGAA